MTRIRMHISKVKLPFYPPGEVKCRLQNEVSTFMFSKFVHPTCLILSWRHGFAVVKTSYLGFVVFLGRRCDNDTQNWP